MEKATVRRPTVVLVDDHAGFLASTRSLVQAEYEVLAALDDSRRAVEAVSVLRPDVVVLDIAMPGLNGLAAARLLRDAGFKSNIIFLTAMEDFEYAHAARELGASFVVKRRMHQELLKAIRSAVEGGQPENSSDPGSADRR